MASRIRLGIVCLGVTLAAVVVFGVAPAISGSRVAPIEALQEAGRNIGGRRSLSSTLIVSQVAVSMVLLIVAGLLLKSHRRRPSSRTCRRTTRISICARRWC